VSTLGSGDSLGRGPIRESQDCVEARELRVGMSGVLGISRIRGVFGVQSKAWTSIVRSVGVNRDVDADVD
jgi:hypothetical protein